MHKKGQLARALIYITALLVLLGVVYTAFTPVIDAFDDSGLTDNTRFEDTADLLFQSWAKWPLIVVFGLVILTIIISARGTPQQT